MNSQDTVLVLVADSDQQYRATLTTFLSKNGIKTAVAKNSIEVLEMVSELQPQVVLVSSCLSGMDDISFIEIIQQKSTSTSVIITSTDAEVKTAVKAIKKGAADFLVKPGPEEVLEKIRFYTRNSNYISNSAVNKENILLYDAIRKIASSRDFTTLLSLIFESSISLTSLSNGVLYIFDPEKSHFRKIKSCGEKQFDEYVTITSAEMKNELVRFIYSSGKPALSYENNDSSTFVSTHIDNTGNKLVEIGVPIFYANEIIAVVVLASNHSEALPESDLSIIEGIVLQAGFTICSTESYSSVSKKLEELTLITNFSEQLMGIVDIYELLNTLCYTILKHFSIDMLGFFLVQKRIHEFVYWTRWNSDENKIREISSEVIKELKAKVSMPVNEKRVRLRRFYLSDLKSNTVCNDPFAFKYVIPVHWGENRWGAFFFGSVKALKNRSETITLLSNLVNQTRIALTNSKLYSDIKENYIRTIKALAIAVDAKDTYTHGHSENVMNIAEKIARTMNLDEKAIGIIRDAGLLHDIGKIGIPGYILNKPGPLTYEEFNGIMKTHSTLGANIVKDVPFLRDLYQLILYHHEHFDGSGYPEGIKGKQIPIGARILHVADAFEAMVSNRPYRSSLGEAEAIKRLTEEDAKQFDPDVIQAFLKVLS